MDVKRLVEFTTTQLEGLSQQVFRTRPDIELAIPVNLELLIEDLPNVSLVVKENLVVAHSIEGYVRKQEVLGHDIEVVVDKNIVDGNWPRYNAVLGEEFAHLELHMALVHAVQTVDDFIQLQRDPAWPQYERDAKWFSLAMRMPAALLVQEAERLYPKIVDEHGYGDTARVEKFLRNSLAELFRVPPADMQRRMMDWPCHILQRIESSVQAKADFLIPTSWSLRAVSPGRQQSLLPD